MKRRIFAFISAALLLIGNMLLFAVHAFAESAEKVGYWKLISVETVGPDSQFDDAQTSGGSGHYTCTAKCTDSRIMAYHDGEHETSCAGETAQITIDVDEPPSIIKPGEEIALNVSPSFSASQFHDSLLFYACTVHVDYAFGGYNGEGDFKDKNGTKYLGIDRTWQYDDYYGAAGQGNHFFVIDSDNVLRHTFDEGRSKLWIRITFSHGRGEDAISTYYNYEWVDEKEKEKETEGYWELSETVIPDRTERTVQDFPHTVTAAVFGDGEASAKFSAQDNVYDSDGSLSFMKGDTVSASLVYTRPESRYEPYDVISIEFSAVSDYVQREDPLRNMFIGLKADISVESGYIDPEGDTSKISGRKTKKFSRVNGNSSLATDQYYPVRNGKLSGLAPAKPSDSDKGSAVMWLYVNIDDAETSGSMGIEGASVIYKYNWKDGKMPAGAGSEKSGGSGKTDGGNEPAQWINQLVETDADDRPGEDGGHLIIPAIVIGISTVGAAAGAGAVASSAAKHRNNTDAGKEQTAYRMHIGKDFGDTLRKGAPPAKVYARIVSIGAGAVVPEPQLTSQIAIYSETQGVDVSFMGMTANGQCAAFSVGNVPDGTKECVIVFRYKGKGGVFTEKVRFKVECEAAIEFVCLKADGTYKVMAEKERTFRALLGTNAPLALYIRVKGFAQDADSVEAVCGALSVRVSRAAPFVYKLEISESLPAAKFGVFPLEHAITINASNSSGEKASAKLTMQYYPYGVFVDTANLDKSSVKEKYIEVPASEFIDKDNYEFRPTLFRVFCSKWGDEDDFEADIRETGKDSPLLVLEPACELSEKVFRNYMYELSVFQEPPVGIRFKPKRGLFQLNDSDEYLFRIRVTRTRRNISDDGWDYDGSFYVRLIGMPDSDKYYERAVEIDKIYYTIAMFNMQNEPGVQTLLERIDRVPTDILKKWRRWVYDLGYELQMKEFVFNEEVAKEYTRGIKVCETIRWFDDMAFSIAIRYFFTAQGMDGGTADAILTPLKNFVFDAVGEAAAQLYWGSGNSDFSLKALVIDKAETAMNGYLWGKAGNIDDPRKAIAIIVIAAIINTGRHAALLYDEYKSENKEIDGNYYWKIVSAVCANMTVNGLKALVGKYIIGDGKGADDLIKKNFSSGEVMKDFLQRKVPGIKEMLTTEKIREIAGSLTAEYGIGGLIDSIIGGIDNYTGALMKAEKTTYIPIFGDEAGITVEIDYRSAWTFLIVERLEFLRLDLVSRIFGGEGFRLPDECPYVHRRDMLGMLEQHGYGSEVRFLVDGEYSSTVDPHVFAEGAQRPTVDTGTDFHRYSK